MARETYGIIEAQRRFREWMPHLSNEGERTVYGALLSYFGMDGKATPTAAQLASLTDYQSRSVRRILQRLEKAGALMRVGSRPVADSHGLARGGSIPIWTIPSRTLEGPGGDSQQDPNPIPAGPKRTSSRTELGHPLIVEKLKPSDCRHLPIDEEGYCTACGTWTRGDGINFLDIAAP